MHNNCRKIFLIGFMGSGKSTAGKKLAARLGWSFIDLDEKVEQRAGLKIPEIFSVKGEEWFRNTEADILRDTEEIVDTVISTGGGTPCFGDNMDHMLKTGITVYLRMTPRQLEKRLKDSKSGRPLISNISSEHLHDFIDKKLKEREKFYSRAVIIVEDYDIDDSSLFSLVRERIRNYC